jgi:5'-methylthioadenosine phosphorylase
MLGATQLLSISAVGSMKEHIAPGHFVVVDQFIDLTRRRISTFFDEDFVAHVAFADPICPDLSRAVAAAAERAGLRVHCGGTYVCIDGPQFSTRAESLLYRSWGVSVIGMTAMPEAKLAREAELPYALLALSTDYDCWHATEADVTVEAVLAVLKANAAGAQRTLTELAVSLPDPSRSPAARALVSALVSDPKSASPGSLDRLRWLIGPYVSKEASS